MQLSSVVPILAHVLVAVCSGTDAVAKPQPPCRKAANLHAMKPPGQTEPAHELVMFGGKGALHVATRKKGRDRKHPRFFGDTWSFDMVDGDWQMPEEVPGPGAREPSHPAARWKMESTTIRNHSALLMVGGSSTSNARGVFPDLWMLKFLDSKKVSWQPVITGNFPAARRGHVVAANDTHLVIFGGKTWTNTKRAGTYERCIRDLWILPLSALEPGSKPTNWTQGTTFPGACRWGATGEVLVTPEGRSVVAYFGGRSLNPNATWHSTDKKAYEYFNELWFYDFLTDSWTLAAPEGPIPQRVDHHGAATLNNDLYVFGGRVMEARSSKAVSNELWSYSLRTNRWTLHTASSWLSPSARYMPAVTASHWQGAPAIVVFGGETLPGSTKKTSLNDLWVYIPGGDVGWIKLLDTHCSAKWTGLWDRNEEEENALLEEEDDDEEETESIFDDDERIEHPRMASFILIATGAFFFTAALASCLRGKWRSFRPLQTPSRSNCQMKPDDAEYVRLAA